MAASRNNVFNFVNKTDTRGNSLIKSMHLIYVFTKDWEPKRKAVNAFLFLTDDIINNRKPCITRALTFFIQQEGDYEKIAIPLLSELQQWELFTKYSVLSNL